MYAVFLHHFPLPSFNRLEIFALHTSFKHITPFSLFLSLFPTFRVAVVGKAPYDTSIALTTPTLLGIAQK
jgi:hypothetical protein